MEFLYKLYGNDYFGIGLFAAIIILAFSFLIILFFGKKDEKARRVEKEKNLKELENQANIIKEEVKPDINTEIINSIPEYEENRNKNIGIEKMEIPSDISALEISEKNEELNTYEPENIVRDFDLEEENPKEDIYDYTYQTRDLENYKKDDIFEENMYNHESVNDIIYNDKDFEKNIDLDIDEGYEFNSKQNDDNNYNFETYYDETPVIEETNEQNIFSEPIEKEEAPRRTTMPRQFSSVYLSKEKEEPKEDIFKDESRDYAFKTSKPDLDMPKPFDLPKLNKDSGSLSSFNDSIIKSFDDDDNLKKLFASEEETYKIDK